MTICIRPAVSADLVEIARIVVASWRYTFAGILPAAFLESMSIDQQAERHRRAFERNGVTYHVAEDEMGGLVGFISGGRNRDPAIARGLEVYAIYLLPAYQGRKIGSLLLLRLLEDLGQMQERGLVIFVLADNPNRAFYRHLGGHEQVANPLTLASIETAQLAYTWDNVADLVTKLRPPVRKR